MIVEPNTSLILFLELLPIIVGFIISFLFIIKGNDNFLTFSLPLFIGGVITFSLLFLWGEQQVNDYNAQIHELISSTKCIDLPQLVKDYPSWKAEIVDEITLRCLIDNPEIKN